MHTGSIDFNGRKEFNTVLSLTNGLSVDIDETNEIVYPDDDEDFETDQHIGITFER